MEQKMKIKYNKIVVVATCTIFALMVSVIILFLLSSPKYIPNSGEMYTIHEYNSSAGIIELPRLVLG